jgi:uncharacterized protein YycO
MKQNVILFLGAFILIIGASAFYVIDYSKNRKTKSENLKKELREGDIIFQSTNSRQCAAVKLVTQSDWSHCGLIFNRYKKKDDWWVLEAVQPVRWTKLKNFIARGTGGHYEIKRLANSVITDSVGDVLQGEAEKQLGKNYDALFAWGNESIYCSELVWKTYHNILGLEIGKTQTLKDFDLSHPSVNVIAVERYGDNFPWEEKVISPQAIYENKNLSLVIKQ